MRQTPVVAVAENVKESTSDTVEYGSLVLSDVAPSSALTEDLNATPVFMVDIDTCKLPQF